MKWTDIPHGTIAAAEQRLWVATGNNADMIVTRINTSPQFLVQLVTFATSPQELNALDVIFEANKLLRLSSGFSARKVKRLAVNEAFAKGKTINGISISGASCCEQDFETEENVEAAELGIYRLRREARNLSTDTKTGIVAELGPKYETRFAHLFQLLAHKQRVKNFTRILAYVRNLHSARFVIECCYCEGGWSFGRDIIEHPHLWPAGIEVVAPY